MISLEQSAETALRIVRECPTISFDTETTGVDWTRNQPIGYVLTDSASSVYVPIRHGGGGNLNDPTGSTIVPTSPEFKLTKYHPFEVELAKAFRYRQTRKDWVTAGHNMGFDCHMSANAGVMLGRNIACTQNTQTLIDEYTPKYGLSDLAKQYHVTAKLGDDLYKHIAAEFNVPNDRKSMGHFWRLAGNDPLAWDYAAGDGVTTIELYREQCKEIEKQDLRQIVAMENELIWTIFRMERRGIPIDTKYVADLLAYIEKQVDKARSLLPKDFNPRSPNQMKEWMGSNGHTDWPTTDKGNPSFTADWLEKSDAGKLVVDLRQWTNLVGTFVNPLINDHFREGKIHPRIAQNRADNGGTISGRLACAAPNLQAVPKHNVRLAYKLRSAFVAEEGMKFCEADISQAEPCLFAHYSQDPRLLGGYNSVPRKDVHTLVSEMMGVDRKTTGKRMNMGIFTGMMPKTFSEHMGWDIQKATEMWNEWYKLFPGVKDFQNTAIGVMKRRGFVKTLLGRHGRLEHPRFAYKAVSKIIQGGNADIVKYKLVEIDKELEKLEHAYLFMSIHDSLLWQSPVGNDEFDKFVVHTLTNVQGPPFNLRVPFTADFDSGKNWAEASYGAEGAKFSIYRDA